MAKESDNLLRHPIVATVVGGLILACFGASFKVVRNARIWPWLWALLHHPFPAWVGLLALISGVFLGIWLMKPTSKPERPVLDVFWHRDQCWWTRGTEDSNLLQVFGAGQFTYVGPLNAIALVRAAVDDLQPRESFTRYIELDRFVPERKDFFILIPVNPDFSPPDVWNVPVVFTDHSGQEHKVQIQLSKVPLG